MSLFGHCRFRMSVAQRAEISSRQYYRYARSVNMVAMRDLPSTTEIDHAGRGNDRGRDNGADNGPQVPQR